MFRSNMEIDSFVTWREENECHPVRRCGLQSGSGDSRQFWQPPENHARLLFVLLSRAGTIDDQARRFPKAGNASLEPYPRATRVCTMVPKITASSAMSTTPPQSAQQSSETPLKWMPIGSITTPSQPCKFPMTHPSSTAAGPAKHCSMPRLRPARLTGLILAGGIEGVQIQIFFKMRIDFQFLASEGLDPGCCDFRW